MTALAPAAPAVVGVAMMNEEEAREAIDWMRAELEQADLTLMNFRRLALDFKEREGWRALGYSGYIQAIQDELGSQYSKSYLSRLLKAAEIERVLELPIGNSVPESQLRPLNDLDTPDQQRDAWQQAVETSGGVPTARHVQQAVDQIKPPAAPRATDDDPTADQVEAMRKRCYALGYEQFYRSDAGWTAYHPKTKKANYKTWSAVEADIARKEGMAAPRVCASCGGPWGRPGSMATSEGLLCPSCAAKRLSSGQPIAPVLPPPLPPAPPGWIIWRNEDQTIGLQHDSGYKVGGTDAGTLIAEARALESFLTELQEGEWKVFCDPMCPPELHAYTAIHDRYDAIGAHSIPRLALAAWWRRMVEADLPDLPNELIDALYLAQHDPIDLAMRGLPLGELYHLAGLKRPPTPAADPGPHLPPPPEWKAAQQRAASLGLRLEMDVSGVFRLYRLSDGKPHNSRDDWPGLLDVLSVMEGARHESIERAALPPTPGIEERLGTAIEQANHLLRLLEATNWAGAQHTCRLLARTMGVYDA